MIKINVCDLKTWQHTWLFIHISLLIVFMSSGETCRIGAKANLNLGPTIENYGGETFLSQEVAINLLQESKLAFKRCQSVSNVLIQQSIEQ